nr:MAG TPA: Portal protein [Caudoviricetes sp.]DAQ82964.1 MAG TPA: Portal protein [Caudoviricetes sp.]
MSEEQIKRKRGRPLKSQTVEINSTNISEINSTQISQSIQTTATPSHTYEYNSYFGSIASTDIFGCNLYDEFTPEEIRSIIKDPISNHDLTRRLAMFVYNSEGVVTNSIDYMVSLPCLDRVIYGKKRLFGKTKLNKNKDLMLSTLENINDKQFIRDALFTDMNEGNCFYYFEVTKKPNDNTKALSDYDVENIVELCDMGMNASIISLPYEYTKIVGRKNNRNVIAFNMRYFDEKCVTQEERNRKLKKYPSEIRNGYLQWEKGNFAGNNWLILDNKRTIAHKIKCKISEPWGRPLAIAAIADILYQNEFVDTKRNVLKELNNRIVVQTLPEGKDKGSCALTKSQQEDQHNKVKQAVMTKNNRGGTSFFTVSAGTKIDTLDVGTTDIFDSKNEGDLTDKIALDLGFAAQLLGASSTGTFAGGQHNLEMVNAQIYTWIQELQTELNYVINENIIKDRRNRVEVYYLPTSLVNRQQFFDMMKNLYLQASGSMTMLIASTGINPDIYFNILDEEYDNKIFDKYVPHLTSNTISKDDQVGGRPKTDNPTENTMKSQNNDGNNLPSPSDNK